MKLSLQLNPLKQTASWGAIKQKRDELELSPVALDNGDVYDYDEKAKLRFETALSQFDNLPTLVDGKLNWKLADNSFKAHSKTELQAIYDELQQKTAIRAALLFAAAEQLAQSGATLGEIQSDSSWGT